MSGAVCGVLALVCCFQEAVDSLRGEAAARVAPGAVAAER